MSYKIVNGEASLFVGVDVDMDDVSFVYPVEGKILAF